MTPGGEQTDRRWSVTAVVLQVPHNAEPLSPSGRQDWSTVYMTLIRQQQLLLEAMRCVAKR